MQSLAFEGKYCSDVPAATHSTIVVAGRHALWRDTLALALSGGWPGMLFRSVDACSAEKELEKTASAAVILVGGTGPAVDAVLGDDLRRLTKANPATPVLVITDIVEGADITSAVRAGAKGYLTSDIVLEVLIQSLRLLLIGGTTFPAIDTASSRISKIESTAAFPPDKMIEQSSTSHIHLFTPKELEVLNGLGEGKPNKVIAYELGICETTVKVHMRHIMRKLGVSNRTHAALLASEMLTDED